MRNVIQKSSGFTLIELIVVIGVAATLIAFTTTNLLGLQRHTHVQTTVSVLATDLYAQRQHAMIGDTQGRATTDSYGIYFQTGNYTLFHGAAYSAASPDNIVIPFESPIQMTGTTLTGSTIVFAKGSGEVVGYSATHNAITLTNSSSNEQVTVTINQYGTITSNLP